MENIIKELDINYKIDKCRLKDGLAVMEISSSKKSLLCPYCGQESDKVHSVYTREIQDLPLQGRKTVLLVRTR